MRFSILFQLTLMVPDQQLGMDPSLSSLWNDAVMQVISTCQ